MNTKSVLMKILLTFAFVSAHTENRSGIHGTLTPGQTLRRPELNLSRDDPERLFREPPTFVTTGPFWEIRMSCHFSSRRIVMPTTLSTVVSAFVFGSFSSTARAATISWDGGSTVNSFWGTPENWAGDVAPTSTDIANFPSLSSPPPRAPLFSAADNVLGVVVDNSGGYVWQFARDGGATPRSLGIGSSGLQMTGGGTSTWSAVSTSVDAPQTWNISAGTTLSFGTGATINFANKLTKTGSGTLVLPNSTNTGAGGIDILDGTVANPRSTQGAGTGTVTIYNGGTYEARNNNINSSPIVINNGGKLLGTGTGAGIAGTSITLDSATGVVAKLATSVSGDLFALTPAITGGDATSVIEIEGAGMVSLLNGTDSATAFTGTWKVKSGTLRAVAINSLGNRNGTTSLTNVSNPSTVELAGGTIWFAGTTSGSTAVNFNNPINVTASSTMMMDKGGSAGTAATGSSTVSRGLGKITIGTSTLNIGVTSNITGVSSSGNPARFGTPELALTGNAVLNIDKPSGFDLELQANTVTQSTSGLTLTKDGNGWLAITGASSGFTGQTVINAGRIRAGNATSMGSGGITVATGATMLFAAGLSSWNVKNDLSGSGTVQVESGTTSITLTGSQVNPGNTSAGILTLAGKPSFAKDGTEFSSLTIDITGGGQTAGIDHDQLNITGGAIASPGLLNANLYVNFAGVNQADLTGDVLTIVLASGTNFAGQSFNSVIFSNPGASATVNYLNGSITLSNIVVPEPAGLTALALVAGGLLRRRSRHLQSL